MTMLYQTSRAASLPPFLKNLSEDFPTLKPAFDKAFRSDFRGMRLTDMLGLGHAAKLDVQEMGRHAHKDTHLLELLLRFTDSSNALGMF